MSEKSHDALLGQHLKVSFEKALSTEKPLRRWIENPQDTDTAQKAIQAVQEYKELYELNEARLSKGLKPLSDLPLTSNDYSEFIMWGLFFVLASSIALVAFFILSPVR